MEQRDSELCMIRARAADCAKRSEAGGLYVFPFMSPAQAEQLRRSLAEQGVGHRAVFWGGFEDAQRCAVFVLPSYTDMLDGDAREKLETYFSDEIRENIRAVMISGSGFCELEHRDYLGSILSLGLDRSVLGDIAVIDGSHAVAVCTARIAEFLLQDLKRVAGDAVRVEAFEDIRSIEVKTEFRHISATIASNRLDCIVSALTGLSREKAQALIEGELCRLDYITEKRREYPVKAQSIISVQGYGKYILRGYEGSTKKGRLRISADKFI